MTTLIKLLIALAVILVVACCAPRSTVAVIKVVPLEVRVNAARTLTIFKVNGECQAVLREVINGVTVAQNNWKVMCP